LSERARRRACVEAGVIRGVHRGTRREGSAFDVLQA